jgi:hypothetical protein
MKRLFLAGLVLVAAMPAATSNASVPPRASLAEFSCQPALEPSQREVSVEAVMRPVAGTKRMALRFVLLIRTRGEEQPTEVAGHDLGNWVTPNDPTLGQRPGDVWNVEHPVIGLVAPASYRFRVTFRWTGARARVLGTVVRETPACFQPELRPNLLVQSITVEPAPSASMNDYLTVIANTGATGAGPFEVLFSPGGGLPVKMRTINRLRAHSKRALTFVGPACTVVTDPTVTVDPLHQVDDVDPANNSLTATCPSGA